MTTKSKRLLIVDDFPYVGGAEKVILQIASHLDHERFDPVVVAPRPDLFSKELQEVGANVQFIDFDRLKRSCFLVFPILPAIIRLVRLIKRERINVIHANSLWTLKFCTLASLLTKVPTVAMIHAYPKIQSRLKRLVHVLTRRFCYRRAAKIVAVSNALKDALMGDRAPADKIAVIPNGVEPSWFAEAAELPRGEPRTVLTVGRLHPGKGQQVFLRAAAIVKRKFPDTRFVIVGEEYRTSLENLGFKQTLKGLAEELGISDAVEFVGYTRNLRDLYAQSSVVVAPSFEETFGLVALEAMAAARPVVASRIPGITELIEDGQTGLLFEAGNHEELGAQIIRLLSDDPLALRLSENALTAARSRYNFTTTIARLEGVYDNALGAE